MAHTGDIGIIVDGKYLKNHRQKKGNFSTFKWEIYSFRS